MKLSITARALILCICFLAGAGVMARGRGPVAEIPRESLSTLPMEIGSWSGQPTRDLSDNTREMLRVSDYANRTYTKPDGASVQLYVGYHPDGGFHSPLNCMPGSGWIPVKNSRIDLEVQAAEGSADRKLVRLNRIVILKGLDKQVTLYWYQGCGRVVASEYWGLIYGMIDKMRLGRTDGALVRVISPAASLEPEAEAAAERNAVDFTRQLFPLLGRYIPD
jgi:EpsI family protein